MYLEICGLALGDEVILHLNNGQSGNDVRRVGLHLPQTCQQLNMDCTEFLETYTTLAITQDFNNEDENASCTFDTPLRSTGRSFSTVRDLRLSANTGKVWDELLLYCYDPYLKTNDQLCADCGHLRQMFRSLERLFYEERHPEAVVQGLK